MSSSFGGAVTIWAWILLVKYWPVVMSGLFLLVKRKSLQNRWMAFFAALGICYVIQILGGFLWQGVGGMAGHGAARTAFFAIWSLQIALAVGALFFMTRQASPPDAAAA